MKNFVFFHFIFLSSLPHMRPALKRVAHAHAHAHTHTYARVQADITGGTRDTWRKAAATCAKHFVSLNSLTLSTTTATTTTRAVAPADSPSKRKRSLLQ